MFLGRPMHRRKTGMDEQLAMFILIIQPHPVEKSKMPLPMLRINTRIAVYRRLAAMQQPIRGRTPAIQPFRTPGIMIAQQEEAPIMMIQFHEIVDHLPGLRPSVYIIAQEDQPVIMPSRPKTISHHRRSALNPP